MTPESPLGLEKQDLRFGNVFSFVCEKCWGGLMIQVREILFAS